MDVTEDLPPREKKRTARSLVALWHIPGTLCLMWHLGESFPFWVSMDYEVLIEISDKVAGKGGKRNIHSICSSVNAQLRMHDVISHVLIDNECVDCAGVDSFFVESFRIVL